ncbi:MAG: DUF4910 domain-containing protein [Bryobacteraceae bacterium]|nr:DUF4910 domain-containing protein [Bryobacteraceae bacterium]
MHELIRELYPVCRSITGNGVRHTLSRLSNLIPLSVREIPTGTPVFDWIIPKEWNIRDAWVKDATGRKVVDFTESSLHVLSYSVPVKATLTWDELRPHLYSDPSKPDWIPYRTSYYAPHWGFCVTQRMLEAFPPGPYDVCIDSTLADGSLTYGECYLPGSSPDKEILISCHICHPSLCNDNLSGIAVAAFLAFELLTRTLRHSVRLLFIPGTIGSIAWLAANEESAKRIVAGLVLTCVGDSGPFTYKRSRRGNSAIDRIMEHVIHHSGGGSRVVDFTPWGYDERQYCSPGFDLPVGCLMRSPHGTFPEYHTSADNPDFVSARSLAGALDACLEAIQILEGNRVVLNRMPKCEPQLGKRGLYGSAGGSGIEADRLALLWVLNQSDGEKTLLDIAERSQLPFATVDRAASILQQAELVQPS